MTTTQPRGRDITKALLYSGPSRATARSIIRPAGRYLAGKKSSINYRDLLKSVASEQLPAGQFYARLTIENWRAYEGQSFELLFKGERIFGSKVLAPDRGRNIQYRNIVVPSDTAEDYSLSIRAPFTLQFREGTYSTPRQIRYDESMAIEQHGLVHYALRGNTRNPKQLVFTFPDFALPTSEIVYPVDMLEFLEDEDLTETAVVAVQDRYGVFGNFMSRSYAGEDLAPVVTKALSKLQRRLKISKENVLFYGVRKGANIALTMAEEFPQSRLLLVSPLLDIHRYLTEPEHFGDLYQQEYFWQNDSPQQRLRKYAKQQRDIDIIVDGSDADYLHDFNLRGLSAPTVKRYRLNSTTGDIEAETHQLCVSLLRRFMGQTDRESGSVRAALPINRQDGTGGAKLRINAPESDEFDYGSQGFLVVEEGENTLYQQMSPNPSSVGWSLSAGQLLNLDFDPIGGSIGVELQALNGDVWVSDRTESPWAGSAKKTDKTPAKDLKPELSLSVEYRSNSAHQLSEFLVYRAKKPLASDGLHVLCTDTLSDEIIEAIHNPNNDGETVVIVAAAGTTLEAFEVARQLFGNLHKQTLVFDLKMQAPDISDAIDIAQQNLVPFTVVIDNQQPHLWTGAQTRGAKKAMDLGRLIVNQKSSYATLTN